MNAEKAPPESKVDTATRRIKDLDQLGKRAGAVIQTFGGPLTQLLNRRRGDSERALREALDLPMLPGGFNTSSQSYGATAWPVDDDKVFLRELSTELVSLGQALAREASIKDA